ncbi:BMP family ABC transporter substrate-binding protein [Clostridium sp. DJ247]|uniref:BMP family ABC transporter substrate-binding protein n=1 Tax=Clostridium sp. DJ247 TaxID=2726188 RepID=UPI0016243A64|nr:BMP family ABC transporter substrate-binding protein [Clostridium sp. DJ247]MBC2582503.1 BMP family ABC transporter substrate-binding protein [Clostridium sp. DJ247]
MRKKLSLVLATALSFSILLGGCGAQQKSTAEKPAENEKIKVGFILSGPVSDGGYNYAHDLGRKQLEKETGVETIYKESVKEDPAEVQKVAEDMINQGATVIIGASFGFMDGIEAEAKKHPDIKFLHGGGYKQLDNMSNYFGREYEARYLSGIVAGMKTKTNKLGFVGAHPIPEVIRGIDAFTLGARSVNPNATVKVVWTNTWYDPAKEKEAAKALIAQGADVIAQHQNTAGPQQAAEEAGVFSVGYNVDMSKSAPKANLTSDIFNWGTYYVKAIKEIQNGTWKSESYWGGIKDGVVDIAPLTANVPEGAKEAVEKAKADIVSGKNKVFVGPIKDQTGAVKVPEGSNLSDKEIHSLNWFVEGVEGTIPKK